MKFRRYCKQGPVRQPYPQSLTLLQETDCPQPALTLWGTHWFRGQIPTIQPPCSQQHPLPPPTVVFPLPPRLNCPSTSTLLSGRPCLNSLPQHSEASPMPQRRPTRGRSYISALCCHPALRCLPYLHELLRGGKAANTEGHEDPATGIAALGGVVGKLLAELAVNLVPGQRGRQERGST